MATPKKYLHDKTVLLLLTINYFFAFLITLLVTLALTDSSQRVFTIEHRPSLGLDANTVGGAEHIVSLIIFVIFVAIANTVLGSRIYPIKKYLALIVLGMGSMVIVFTGIVSYYLLQK
ncbi:hypothetical protein KA068_00205 [Candidatus Saccharibacteria bacterium]|jgi:hypothetical protein|nr:hypothetical protein [Candidatus Saccharibacteria bacterium]